MNIFRFLFIICTNICVVLTFARCTTTDEKRFIVVSEYETARNFYPPIRALRTRIDDELTNLDVETKEQICKDVTSSDLFRRNKEYPYEETDCFSRFLCIIIGCYNYPTEVIQVTTPAVASEYVFECLARTSEGTKKIFISAEYNLDDTGTVSSDSYTPGRFIFKKSKILETTYLHGLAEIISRAFLTTLIYNIELMYLQRRAKYGIPRSPAEDALCWLAAEEKLRICTAIFRSTYFEEKNISIYPSYIGAVDWRCKLRIISFQTELGKAKAAGRNFHEWMLNCWVPGSPTNSNYLLSQAYQSNQIFVYFRDKDAGDVFLENLSVGVRLPVKRESIRSRWKASPST